MVEQIPPAHRPGRPADHSARAGDSTQVRCDPGVDVVDAAVSASDVCGIASVDGVCGAGRGGRDRQISSSSSMSSAIVYGIIRRHAKISTCVLL